MDSPPSIGNLPKTESLRGVPKFLLEREDNLEREGVVATFLFFYNSVTFTIFEFEVF